MGDKRVVSRSAGGIHLRAPPSPRSMALLSLNHDVLCEILAQTDSQSALKLSMTSRKAHDLGVPQALSDVTLSRSQAQISAFCRFVLADAQNRLPYLRELTITSAAFGVARHIEFQRTVDFSAASDLAVLLAQADRLKRISIACFEDLIMKEPRVGAAICALPNLADIGFHNSGHLTMALLPSMRSRPRRFAFTALFNRKLPTFFHRLVVLDGLQALEVANLDLSDGSQPHAEVHGIPHMPSLRSLTLRGTTARMSLFVRAMPNLQSLKITDVFTKVDGDHDHLKEGCWRNLARLKGNVPDFRHWKVTCPVRWLQLDLTAYHYQDVVDVIQRNSPIILSLPVETKVDAAFWTHLVGVVPRLRYLEICLDEGKVQKLETWMNEIPQIIGTLPIVAIFLCVRKTHYIDSQSDTDFNDSMRDTVFTQVPQRMANAVSSLRYIGLVLAKKGENPFEGPQATPPSWWRIAGGSEIRKLDAIPVDRGTRLRDHLLNANYDQGSHV